MFGEGKIIPRDHLVIWHLTSQMKDAFISTSIMQVFLYPHRLCLSIYIDVLNLYVD